MKISTLGPRNTNSQFAAEHYLKSNSIEGEVLLFDTPEHAIEELKDGSVDKAILCVVYPALNEIVFRNLGKIKMVELYAFDTDNMVVAGVGGVEAGMKACTHPAPKDLLPAEIDDVTIVSSNSYAASLVAKGEFDICVTTQAAMKEFNLSIVRDYGPVPMGWAVFDRA